MRSIPILLLFTVLSSGMDPPALLWEKWFFEEHDGCYFSDIELVSADTVFITGSAFDWTEPILPYYCAFLFDVSGNLLWAVEQPWYVGKGNDGVVLPDGSFVITGRCIETESSTYSLFIMKIDQSGSIEWTRIYDYPETKEEGYGITSLPDGGFAVCGRVNGTGIWAGQAWLLRTDSQGDTLWTEAWGTDIENYGKVVRFNNNEICVLACGGTDSLPEGITHLLFYDLEGIFLRAIDYPELYYHFPRGMCIASDEGYTFTTDVNPVLWHTDQYGETLWWHSIYNYGNEEGFDVIRTMDSGYLFCGWGGKWQEPSSSEEEDCTSIPAAAVDTGWTEDAWLVKFDEDGNQQWEFKREAQTNHCHYYSVVQLPEGGYIACGKWSSSGYLARFAPEAGISEPENATSPPLTVYPNPCSSVLSIRFSLIEPGPASIRIYDLSGRLKDTMADEVFPAGESTVEWVVPDDVSSGCYLIQYNSTMGSISERCVLIN